MARESYLWDYDIEEADFREILAGRKELGLLNRDWAAVRLLEHASYPKIVRLLGYRNLVEGWPRWRSRIRSEGRRRGFDFLAEWLPERHPELLDSHDQEPPFAFTGWVGGRQLQTPPSQTHSSRWPLGLSQGSTEPGGPQASPWKRLQGLSGGGGIGGY